MAQDVFDIMQREYVVPFLLWAKGIDDLGVSYIITDKLSVSLGFSMK